MNDPKERGAYWPPADCNCDINAALVEALENANTDFAAIRSLIDEAVNQKIRGERKRINWARLVDTIACIAENGNEYARAALRKAKG